MTSDADPEYDRILGFEEIYEMAVKEVERRRIESDKKDKDKEDKDIKEDKEDKDKDKKPTLKVGCSRAKKPRLSTCDETGYKCLGCEKVFKQNTSRARHWGEAYKRGEDSDAACSQYYKTKRSSHDMDSDSDF
jgi:hypothetical protein